MLALLFLLVNEVIFSFFGIFKVKKEVKEFLLFQVSFLKLLFRFNFFAV